MSLQKRMGIMELEISLTCDKCHIDLYYYRNSNVELDCGFVYLPIVIYSMHVCDEPSDA